MQVDPLNGCSPREILSVRSVDRHASVFSGDVAFADASVEAYVVPVGESTADPTEVYLRRTSICQSLARVRTHLLQPVDHGLARLAPAS